MALLLVGCGSQAAKPVATPARAVEERPAEAKVVAAPVEAQPVEVQPVEALPVEAQPVEAKVVYPRTAPIRDDVVVLRLIEFPQGSSEVTEEGRKIVETVAQAMNGHPALVLLEVAGHARPGVERNPLALSRARSKRIVAELVKRGVAKERLIAAAYSDYCPVEPEPEPTGRALNGGVQFKMLVLSGEGPTGVNHGCPAATAAGLPPPAVPSN